MTRWHASYPSLDEPIRYRQMHPAARGGIRPLRARRPWSAERAIDTGSRVLVVAALAGLSWVVVAAVAWAIATVLG